MAGKSYLRTERGERVEFPDFQHAVDASQRAATDEIGNIVLEGSDSSRAYVIEGFGAGAVGTVITVVRGVGLLSYLERGEVNHGSIVAYGDPTRTIDIAGYADGTYGLYIQMALQDTDNQNRIAWNALATTPVEYTRNQYTRRVENWNIAVEVASPGDDWLKIYDVAKAGGVLTLTDRRDFFYEGKNSNTYAVVDADWGGGNDRNADRATYGVKSLHRALRAILRQIQDGIGGATPQWWKSPTSGTASGSDGPRSLTQLNDEKLAKNGAQALTGVLRPDGNETRDLGLTGTRFRDFFCRDITHRDISGDTANYTTSVAAPGGVFTTLVVNNATAAAYLETDGIAPSPLTNNGRMYRDSIVTVHGHAHSNGSGGIDNTLTYVVGCTVTINGFYLRATFDLPYASAHHYTCVATIGGATVGAPVIQSQQATYVEIGFVDDTGTVIDLSTVSRHVHFMIAGKQA